MLCELLSITFSIVILLHFVEGSRWSWGEDHTLVFTTDIGTQYALHELQSLYPDALSRLRKQLPLQADRDVCALILSSKGDAIEAVAAVHPPDFDVCQEFIVDTGDVLVDDESVQGYFPTFGCSVCLTDHTASMHDVIDWEDVAEDLAFESYREDQLMARYEGE